MDLDVTLLFALGLLMVLVVALDRIVFAPLLQVIESRRQQTFGVRREVKQMVQLTNADRTAYDRGIIAARRHTSAALEAQRQHGRERARAAMMAARVASLRQLQTIRGEVAAATRAATLALQPDHEPLARQLAEKLLGRAVRVGP